MNALPTRAGLSPAPVDLLDGSVDAPIPAPDLPMTEPNRRDETRTGALSGMGLEADRVPPVLRQLTFSDLQRPGASVTQLNERLAPAQR